MFWIINNRVRAVEVLWSSVFWNPAVLFIYLFILNRYWIQVTVHLRSTCTGYFFLKPEMVICCPLAEKCLPGRSQLVQSWSVLFFPIKKSGKGWLLNVYWFVCVCPECLGQSSNFSFSLQPRTTTPMIPRCLCHLLCFDWETPQSLKCQKCSSLSGHSWFGPSTAASPELLTWFGHYETFFWCQDAKRIDGSHSFSATCSLQMGKTEFKMAHVLFLW